MMRPGRTIVERVVFAALITTTAVACSKKIDDNVDPQMPSDEIATVEPLAQATTFAAPLDAVPNADGTVVAFTAMTDDGAAVFTIPVAGGAATRIAAGDPLSAPFGIMWSTDGMRIYVADSGAEDMPADGVGRIFGMTAEGGSIAALAGATGTSPRSLELVQENNLDVIYWTGVTADKKAAVFKMNADGSNRSVVATSPLVDPSGITVDSKGVVYVADSSGENGATLYKIENGNVSELAAGMRFGHPAGIALVPSETAVLVSGLDLATAHSAVYKVEVASGQVSSFNNGIAENTDSAGLHRAKKAGVYAWANAAGNTKGETITAGGTVYVLKAK